MIDENVIAGETDCRITAIDADSAAFGNVECVVNRLSRIK